MNDVTIYIDETVGNDIGYVLTEDKELMHVTKMGALNETGKWIFHVIPEPPPNN